MIKAESVASTPKKVKRHLTPPRITRPGGQYESEDEKVLKGAQGRLASEDYSCVKEGESEVGRPTGGVVLRAEIGQR